MNNYLDKKMLFLIYFLAIAIIYAGKYNSAIEYIFPLPNSKYLTSQTTIILRLEEDYRSQITNLDSLIIVTGDSLNPLFPAEYSGNTFWSSDEKTIIFDPDRNLQPGGEIKVKINTSQFGFEDFVYSFYVAKSESNSPANINKIVDEIWNQNNNYSFGTNELSDPKIFNGVVLLNDFPEVESNIYGEVAPGNLFVGVRLGYARYLLVFNNEGLPYFFREAPTNGNLLLHYTEEKPEGFLSSFMGPEKSYFIYNNNFEHIDSYRAGHGYITDNHELQFLQNGHALIIAGQDVKIDMSQLVEGGNTNTSVWGKHIQELDKDHNVVFEWRSWDYYNITDATFISMTGNTIDYVHMNTIEVDYDGNYILSPKTLDEITKINSKTGDIIWRFGGENNQFQVLNDADFPISWQHDVRHVPGKPDEYTLFDNGNNKSPKYSRAVHYRLDTVNMTAEKIWEFRYNPDIYAGQKGAVQILSNGNYYIDWSADGLGVIGTEVTPTGEIVFEFRIPDAKTYRSQKYDFYPVVKTPELIIENYDTTIRLIYNKFGDTTVTSYNVYYGVNPNPTNLLTTTTEAYYDLDATNLAGGRKYYFRATAVKSNGEESDFSNEEYVVASGSNFEPGQNMVFNHDFSQGFDFWEWEKQAETDASYEIDSLGQLFIQISNGGTNYNDIEVKYSGLSLNLFQNYLFEFDAYAKGNRTIDAEVKKDGITVSNIGLTSITREKLQYSYEFKMTKATTNSAEIIFALGNSNDDVYIDNVVLKQVIATGISDESVSFPIQYELKQNYPNPFNPVTTINYSLPEPGKVILKIYDALGKEIITLVDEDKHKGIYQALFNAQNLASGIYFYRIRVSNNKGISFIDSKKLLLLK